MYSTTTCYIVFLICSCLGSAFYADEVGIENLQQGIVDEADKILDCLLWVSDRDALKMPVAFVSNGRNVSIIYPNSKGRIQLKFGRSLKLSCVNSKFASKDLLGESEALVTCAGGDKLLYGKHVHRYEDFACNAMPKSELRVTGETCQPENYTVAAVGFPTKHRFIDLYKICFDKSTMNSLYTWYDARSPYYDNHQKLKNRPQFARSKELYGNTDVNKKYTINQQKKTVAKILGSEKQADKYIKNDYKHFLARGHYAAKADFYFGNEQSATFYYANVAPQWQLFNGKLWANLEGLTRNKLDSGTARHLIVTGSYGSCTLPDVNGEEQPLFLDPPENIPVPLFYWKMYYDLEQADGVVYIGLNNPYLEIDDSVYLCPNICPEGFEKDLSLRGFVKGISDDDLNEYNDNDDDKDEDANQGLIYCCTKKSFEDFYGQLDPAVFQLI